MENQEIGIKELDTDNERDKLLIEIQNIMERKGLLEKVEKVSGKMSYEEKTKASDSKVSALLFISFCLSNSQVNPALYFPSFKNFIVPLLNSYFSPDKVSASNFLPLLLLETVKSLTIVFTDSLVATSL